MATERQIKANRANAAKSTGPITPEGKRASSQNAARRNILAGTVVLEAESTIRFNDLVSALKLQFQPRNPAEAAQLQTMATARWHLCRMWGIQNVAFDLEIANTRQGTKASGPVLAAIAFRSLADNSGSFALMHRLEIAYDRQYSRALALLLKLRAAPGSALPVDPQLATETWDDDSQGEPNEAEPNSDEPNFDTDPAKDPTCNEQVPDIAPAETRFELNPISPSPSPQGSNAPAPSNRPAISGLRTPDTHHESNLVRTSLAESLTPVDVALQPSGP